MSSGTQVDLEWAGSDTGQGGGSAPAAGAVNAGAPGATYLTDEEILGMEPIGTSAAKPNAVIPSEARNLSSIADGSRDTAQRDSSGKDVPRNDNFQATTAGAEASAQMPSWMQAAAADPQHGGEAQQLWREHQEFRAAFASPEEARAIKELLPGGVRDVLTLREATQSVDRIDAAIFSGDARAQSEDVAELARANPAAFRTMFAEAARVLAGMGTRGNEAGGREAENPAVARLFRGGDLDDGARKSLGSEDPSYSNSPQSGLVDSPVTNRQSRVTGHEPRATALESPHFDPAAYAAFERATNDAVARDVRGSIGDTLARVMPDGVAEGAARRIGEDIFNEVHRALAADRTLSEQVASVLRDRRFGGAEQQRVASLLAGRAKQLVPSVARRVIGEWTSTVLDTARSKAARQAAAASRVDIAAPGGSLDSTPLRPRGAGSGRELNYSSMSDEEILGM